MAKVKCCIVYKESNGDLFAFFPEMDAYNEGSGFKTSYSHIGQHGPCGIWYFKECKDATFPRAYELFCELVEQVGYDLEMIDMQEALEIINGE